MFYDLIKPCRSLINIKIYDDYLEDYYYDDYWYYYY